MNRLSKLILGTTIVVAMATVNSHGVDQAMAAADLADISAISVQAMANLSEAALSGDVEAIAEMNKRADAIDAAIAAAQESFAALEAASAAGDDAAAQKAADDLKDSLQKAQDALNGVIPEDLTAAVEAWKNSKKNTGGGFGKPYDPPNMFDVPWNTGGARSFYQDEWGNLFASGRTYGSGESDGTPE